MTTNSMILTFEDYEVQAHKLARALNTPCRIIQRHRFPDAESKLTLPAKLPEHVIFCRSLDHPNEKLLELLLAAKTARDLGASTLTLVAPYLCYMRQDKAFNPGEVVSQGIVGGFLAGLFENVITIDPHLHRIQHLEQAIPTKNAVTLSATSLMAEFLQARVKASALPEPVLLGPDKESAQWVSAVARPEKWAYGVCEKTRTGDKNVAIKLPEIDLKNRAVVIVDDVASSGQTLLQAAKICLEYQAKHVDVLVTHALFVDEVTQQLSDVGVRNIWSTDSVSHASNVIDLDDLIKDALLKLQ